MRWSRSTAVIALGIVWVAALACSPEAPPPSLISPAPRVSERCFHFPIRDPSLNPATILDALNGHVPTALPPGFGLYGLWGGGEGEGAARGHAIWADASCRTVAVTTWAVSEEVGEGPRVGPFTLTAGVPSTCTRPGPTPCLAYRAELSPGLVQVDIVGIDRAAADEIVRSMG